MRYRASPGATPRAIAPSMVPGTSAAVATRTARRGILISIAFWVVFDLLTTTAEDFFVRRGYGVVGRDAAPAVVQKTTEFRSLCPDSAVCMMKHLAGEDAQA